MHTQRTVIPQYPLGIRLYGVLFLMMGACGVYLLLAGHPVSSRQPDRPGDIWGPAIFMLVGIALIGVRRHVVIDPRCHCLRSVRGWGPFTSRLEHPLSGLIAIEVGPPDQRGRQKMIPVRLLDATGAREICCTTLAPQARAWAETMARIAAVPLRDASVIEVVGRHPADDT